jgi:hypothetical protein
MAIGPGKYDDLCTYVREQAKAKAAVIMVFEGADGSGFSCQADLATTLRLPALLRQMADEIEASKGRG